MTAGKMGAILATGTWHSELRAAAAPALAGIAVMAASLVNFLNHNQYPLLTPEVGLVAALLLAGVLLMAIVYACSGRVVRIVLQILLIYVALDLNFDGLLVPLAAVGAAVVLQRHAIPFIAVAASVVLVSMLTGLAVAERGHETMPLTADSERRDGLPVILHLILDEHVGVEGMLGDIPEAAAMGEGLKQFYLGKGFRVFGGAYSEHMRTVNAVPLMLNFGAEQHWNPANRTRTVLSPNAYFDRLGEAGYRIFVSQTDYIDYCTNRFVVHCRTHRAAELVATADAPLSVLEKTEIVASEFAELSDAMLVPLALYRAAWGPARIHAIPPVRPLETFDRIAREVRGAAPGSVFFVHELLPHMPYVFDSNCRFKDRAQWKNHAGGSRAARMAAYVDQVACVNTKLEAIFEAAGPHAVIVVHGDHGSRITDVEPNVETLGAFGDRDLLASYSTIFAVRAPAIEPGYDSRPVPVPEILRELARTDFRSADISLAPNFRPTVVLEGHEWKPVKRHPLPAGWPASATH